MRRVFRAALPAVLLIAGCAIAPVPAGSSPATRRPTAIASAPIPSPVAAASGTLSPASAATTTAAPTPLPCLPSGSQAEINARLSRPGAEAVLCQGAVFELTAPVVYTFTGQKVYTDGHPLDSRRAVLRIVSASAGNAVTMRDFDRAELTNVVIDGARTALGPTSGDALVYAGGSARGQVIAHNVIRDTRTWSSLHLIEGNGPAPCADALVEDNDIGPAGTSDNWADGISLACTTSTVRGNRVTDATDGGIIIFGAPGSLIEANTVTATSRTLLGGINLVDVGPYEGDYSGTIVRGNGIDAAGAVIRIGLGMGERVWGCLPADDPGPLPYGATVTGNALRGAKMQYGYAVSGVTDWTVTGNTDAARHTGKPSVACGATVASKPAGFQINLATSTGTFQREFTSARLDLALWAIVDPRPGQ